MGLRLALGSVWLCPLAGALVVFILVCYVLVVLVSVAQMTGSLLRRFFGLWAYAIVAQRRPRGPPPEGQIIAWWRWSSPSAILLHWVLLVRARLRALP